MNYGFFRIFAKIVIIWGVSGGFIGNAKRKSKFSFAVRPLICTFVSVKNTCYYRINEENCHINRIVRSNVNHTSGCTGRPHDGLEFMEHV